MTVTVLKTLSRTANEQAVSYLKDMLQQAEDGRLTEFIITYKLDGKYTHCWTASENMIEQLGQLARLMALVNKRMDSNHGD